MNINLIYPGIALVISFGGLAATIFFNRKNVKQNEVESLRKDMQIQKENHDKEIANIKNELTECKVARENLTRDRLMLLEQVAFGDAKSYAKNKVDVIESPQVHVEAVK